MQETINQLAALISLIVDNLWQYLGVPIIILVGLYFTLSSGFVQLRLFPKMLAMLGEGFHHTDDSGKKKAGISGFEAFAISIASRVGTGNLAGVAMAISLGGPGAIFWMWVMAFLGMATAFVESTLAQVFKVPSSESGHFRGGPAYYLRNALNSNGIAILFSILMVITFGYVLNMIQVNTIALSFQETFNLSPKISAIVLAIMTILILMGGAKRIANFSSLFVPVMALSYIVVGFIVVIMNYKNIPSVITLIFSSAFRADAAFGGFLGTMMVGVRRGLFSNEAGMGSAPAAAAAANTSHPVKQGLIQSFSVFTDTFVVCSVTAFIILGSGIWGVSEAQGIVLMQEALAQSIGSLSNYYVSILIFIFAFTSVIGNYFYAESSLAYLTKENRLMLNVFKVTVALMVFIGPLAENLLVWNLGDLFVILMAFVNLYAIVRLFPVAKETLDDFTQQLKLGKDPEFKRDRIKKWDIPVWKGE